MGTIVRFACTGVRFTPPSLPLAPLSDGKKQPPPPQSRAALPGSAPSLPDDEAPASQRQPVAKGVSPPKGDVVVSLPVDRRAFDRYIERGSTLRLVKRVIRAHIDRAMQRADREDMLVRARTVAHEGAWMMASQYCVAFATIALAGAGRYRLGRGRMV